MQALATDPLEHWCERSAIMEHDGGLPREEADAMALGDVALRYGWPAAVGLAKQGENDVQMHSGDQKPVLR